MKQLRYWLYLIAPCALLGWATSWGVGVALGVGVLIGIGTMAVATLQIVDRSSLVQVTKDGKPYFVPKQEILRGMFTDTVDGRETGG